MTAFSAPSVSPVGAGDPEPVALLEDRSDVLSLRRGAGLALAAEVAAPVVLVGIIAMLIVAAVAFAAAGGDGAALERWAGLERVWDGAADLVLASVAVVFAAGWWLLTDLRSVRAPLWAKVARVAAMLMAVYMLVEPFERVESPVVEAVDYWVNWALWGTVLTAQMWYLRWLGPRIGAERLGRVAGTLGWVVLVLLVLGLLVSDLAVALVLVGIGVVMTWWLWVSVRRLGTPVRG